MKIKLNSGNLLKNLPTEEELLEQSKLESLYAIRSLKSLVESQENGFVIATETNQHGQAYIESQGIWINKDEYTKEQP